jgi:hypothetical protein
LTRVSPPGWALPTTHTQLKPTNQPRPLSAGAGGVELAFQHSITKVRCMRVIATSIVAYMQACTACVCVCSGVCGVHFGRAHCDVTGRAGCSPCSQHRQAGRCIAHTKPCIPHTLLLHVACQRDQQRCDVARCCVHVERAHRCPTSPGTHRSQRAFLFFFALPPSTPTPAHTPSAAHSSTRKPLHFGVPCVLGTRYDTSGAHHTSQPARSQNMSGSLALPQAKYCEGWERAANTLSFSSLSLSLSSHTHTFLVVCGGHPCPSPHSLANAVVHIHARQRADALRVDAWKASGWLLLDGGSSTFRP